MPNQILCFHSGGVFGLSCDKIFPDKAMSLNTWMPSWYPNHLITSCIHSDIIKDDDEQADNPRSRTLAAGLGVSCPSFIRRMNVKKEQTENQKDVPRSVRYELITRHTNLTEVHYFWETNRSRRLSPGLQQLLNILTVWWILQWF